MPARTDLILNTRNGACQGPTRGIGERGADNLPWVLLVSGVLVGVVMQAHAFRLIDPRSVCFIRCRI